MATLSFNVDLAEVPKISEILRRFGITKIEVSENEAKPDEEEIRRIVAERRAQYNVNPQAKSFDKTIDEVRKRIHDLQRCKS